MQRTAVITTKIEPRLNEDVNAIPKDETLQAIEEIEQDKDLVICKDADDLFRRLEI
ncbi:MAG: hypothetical protein QG657_5601 [Acidobacteriota bacterium]|nr:hypothetical protein [Acidobacteriota bacterium]